MRSFRLENSEYNYFFILQMALRSTRLANSESYFFFILQIPLRSTRLENSESNYFFVLQMAHFWKQNFQVTGQKIVKGELFSQNETTDDYSLPVLSLQQYSRSFLF